MNYFRLLLLVAMCFNGALCMAQSDLSEKIDFSANSWTAYFNNEQISIDYKLEDCQQSIGYDQEKLLLRIQNTSETPITISWHSILEYNGECKTCDYPEEYGYSITLEPNETLEGDCSLEYRHELTYFVKFIDSRYKGFPSELTNFKMNNLTITTTIK